MRVAYVCADPGVPVFGSKGCSIHVQEILRALLQRGDEVVLFASRVGGDPPPGLRDLRLCEITAAVATDPRQRELELIARNECVFKLLDDAGPFDLVYERHALWSVAPMQYASRRHIPGILEVNAPLVDEQSQYRTLIHHEMARAISYQAFHCASSIITVSEGVADYVRQCPGTEAQVHVIPNGVDLDRFALDCRSGGEQSHFIVGFVGTLKAWHGTDLLINAYAQLCRHRPQCRLVIVGDGPLRPQLEKQAQSLPSGLGRSIEFTGAIAPEQVPLQLSRIDVAVAPYPAIPDFYFSPLKVLEYMAASRATIASRIGQIQDIITDGINGVLCTPGDTVDLSTRLLELHDHPELRRSLGRQARETIANTHSWGQVLQRILETLSTTSPLTAIPLGGTS